MESSSDRGYSLLLSHLHNPSTKLSVTTLQGALAHHLATLSPLPTPLAATAISSSYYLSHPFTHTKLQSLATAFRHATHLKFQALLQAAKHRSKMSMLLGRTMETVMGQWVTDVLQGIYGGHSVLRLSACSGLLLGIQDLRVREKAGLDVGNSRSPVEDEIIVSLAEVMDTYSYGISSVASNSVEEWEKEFQPAGQDILSLLLILASQSLPLVPQQKLKALPLAKLSRLLTLTISSAFKSGSFLSSVSASVTLSPTHQVHITSSSPLVQTLQSMVSSPLNASIASISRLTATVLCLLIDAPSSPRFAEGIYSISESLNMLEEMAKQVERDWVACPLASFTEHDIALDSKEVSKSIWTTLKTLLFSIIMLTESVLEASVYIPPQSWTEITPSSLALQTLCTLSHLSFVVSEFGGVTTTAQGFEHLKKTFYLALDVLAQDDYGHAEDDSRPKAEAYVEQICYSLNAERAESAVTSPRRAKHAFVLASIEQLIPVLSNKCIRDSVWGVCYPHLSDPTHRETYESAHSVVLAIFASYAQQQQQYFSSVTKVSQSVQPSSIFVMRPLEKILTTRVFSGIFMSDAAGKGKTTGTEEIVTSREVNTNKDITLSTTFIQHMIPFYASCLIDNSVDGKLSTPQLCLAYSALVRSASASAFTSTETPDEVYSLAWYCVQLIIDTIHEFSPAASHALNRKGKEKAFSYDEKDASRMHRLYLMLISTISSLPLPLMLLALDEIRLLIATYPPNVNGGVDRPDESEKKTKLVEALFHELVEKTGDREKESAIRWWYKYQSTLLPGAGNRKHVAFWWLKSRKEFEGKAELEKGDNYKTKNQLDPPVLSRL